MPPRVHMIAPLIRLYSQALLGLVRFSHRMARWIALGTLLLTVPLALFTLQHLRLDTDTSNMIDPTLPYRQLNAELDRAFPQLDDLIIAVIEAETAEQAEALANRYASELQRHAELFQFIDQPGQGPFFDQHGLLYLDTEELWKLDERLTEAEPFLGTLAHDPSLRGLFDVLGQALSAETDPARLVLLRTIFDGLTQRIDDQVSGRASRPFWREQLLDNENRTEGSIHRRFVLAKPKLDFTSLEVGGDALKMMRGLASELSEAEPAHARIRLTGSVAMADDELGSLPTGAGLATVLSFGLVCLILFVGLRSLRLIGAILLTLVIGLVWTAAFAALAIGHLNVISVTFPVLFIGLGVDFGIQFGMRYREEREHGADHATGLQRTALDVGNALTLAGTAAALSFFSFIPTAYKGLAELGLIAGVGMYIALWLNFTLLPALLTLWPIQPPFTKPQDGALWRGMIWLVGHRRLTLLVSGSTLLAAALVLPHVRFDFNPLHMKDPELESVATFLDLLKDPHASPYRASVIVENLAEAESLAERLAQLDEVDKAITVTSYIPSDQEEKLAMIEELGLVLQPLLMDQTPRPPPTNAERLRAFERFHHQLTEFVSKAGKDTPLGASAARLLHAIERLRATPGWPETALADLERRLLAGFSDNLHRLRTLLMAQPVTLDDLPEPIRNRYLAADGRVRVEVFPKEDLSDNEALRRFVQSVRRVAPTVTDTPVLLLEGGDVVVQACRQATATTLVGAFAIVFLALGRLRDTILVFLPLMMAIVLTLASTVAIDVPLNLANIIAIPLLFGLGIAFGIYLVMRKRSGMDFDQLFHSSTPRAVMFSALTTMASFGTLAFSGHRGTASIGILLTIALCSALFCTLIALPAILAELEARETRRVMAHSES